MESHQQKQLEFTEGNRCQNCGEFVTPGFSRVFGDNHDHVYGCPECMTATEIYEGYASGQL